MNLVPKPSKDDVVKKFRVKEYKKLNQYLIKMDSHVWEADRVYSLLEDWFKDKTLVEALQEARNMASWEKRYKLNIPATIASYFLFYMVTIKDEFEKMNKSDYILNVELITEFLKQSQTKEIIRDLSTIDTVKTLVECGMNLYSGFIWEEIIN